MKAAVGTARQRPDAASKLTGRTSYTADIEFDGALCGQVLRSPHASARIVRMDVSRAERMPGVAAIAWAVTAPRKRLDFGIKDQQLYPTDHVRYAGEPVAAVAAETAAQAAAACAAIEIEYEPLTPVLTIEDALLPDGPLVHPDWQSYEVSPGRTLRRNVCHVNRIRRGDVDAALAAADVVVRSEFKFSRGMPAYLEPRAAIARREPGGGLTLWCGSQQPYSNREDIASFFDLELDKVRFVNQFVGGGFGGKLIPGPEFYVASLALRCDRPVRLVWSRREDTLHVYPRHGGTATFESGVTKDGRFTAMRASFVYDTGAYLNWGSGTALISTMLASAPYRIPNLDLNGMLVYTNKHSAGPVRAPGGPQANFAKESHVDEIAQRLGIDPLRFRLDNAWDDGDVGPSGQRLSGVSAKETLRRAADAIGWESARPEHVGRGLACGWWFCSCTESRARVEIRADGRILMYSGNPEIGTGSAAVALPMLAADALGVDPSRIEAVLADTASDAYDGGVGGSGSTYGSGMAVERAANAAREKLLALAEDALEARADDLELRDGSFTVRGAADHSVSIEDLAARAGGIVEGRGESEGPEDPEIDASSVQGHDFSSWLDPSFVTTAAEVEVDPDTGRTRVRRLVTAQDVGFAINPSGVVGQIEGGAVHGLGFALMEELKYDEGALIDPGFRSYLIPTAVDAPEIVSIVVEQPSAHGPHGMKGVGEPPVTTPAGAIANAIRDAVGVAPHETPMTPERIWHAIDDAQR